MWVRQSVMVRVGFSHPDSGSHVLDVALPLQHVVDESFVGPSTDQHRSRRFVVGCDRQNTEHRVDQKVRGALHEPSLGRRGGGEARRRGGEK